MGRSFLFRKFSPLFAFLLGATGFSLGGCSSAQSVKQAQGRFFITCEKGLSDCIHRADKNCGDKGFTIVKGYQKKKMLGGSSSSYRTAVFVGELTILCGEVDQGEAACVQKGSPVQVDPAAPKLEAAAPRVCVPGSSQSCVGPAGCQGGQYCLSDGSGFGRCDCGPSPSAAQTVQPIKDATEKKNLHSKPDPLPQSEATSPSAARSESETQSVPSSVKPAQAPAN